MLYHLISDNVKLSIQAEGGMIAPVQFELENGHWASPYSLAPWQAEEFPELPPLLQHLRGDFFCFPFGESKGYRYPHGEPANSTWELQMQEDDSLIFGLQVKKPACHLTKRIHLCPGHRVLYQEHTIEGAKGRFNYGHHPILTFPEGVTCPVRVSPFSFGSVYPSIFNNPEECQYSALKQGARFEKLDSVPTAKGGETSLALYPAREGYEDIVMLSATNGQLAWTAVSFPGYVWVALRSVVQFPSTLFWHSNGGRHQPPWSGRHRRRLGVEDVCSHFHDGLPVSAEDRLSHEGIATCRDFAPTQPTILRHAQWVHPVDGQPGLQDLRFMEDGNIIELFFENGVRSQASLDWRWLVEPDLETL